MASVPQSIGFNFDYHVADVVLMGRHPHIPRFTPPSEWDMDIVRRALEEVDATYLKDRSIRQLSGGEKQRVLLARALAQTTDYILLDEITASLDINHAISIMRTLQALVRESGRTVIAALHDLNMALAYCDRMIVLQDGELIGAGTTRDILTEDLIMELYQVHSNLAVSSNGTPHIQISYA